MFHARHPRQSIWQDCQLTDEAVGDSSVSHQETEVMMDPEAYSKLQKISRRQRQ